MAIWWHIIGRWDPSDKLIESVNVSRETEHFLYVDEQQTWDGKRVTRQRRVAKAQLGSCSGSYYPSKSLALAALQQTEANRMERLQKELKVSGQRLIKITVALDQARKDEKAVSISLTGANANE